jgi:cold shock CspA family protein
VITAFDDHAGHGTVVDADRGSEHFVHCTAIADGSRAIPVGAEVTFRVAAGHNGKWEAVDVQRIY